MDVLIKITPFSELYPDGELQSAAMRSSLLYHSGQDFLMICKFLRESYESDVGLFKPNVHIPLMHQCIELMAKAIVLGIDPSANLKKYSHKTTRLLEDYRHSVSGFEEILSASDQLQLITEMEKAYLGLRYGESHSNFRFRAMDVFVSVAQTLDRAYSFHREDKH